MNEIVAALREIVGQETEPPLWIYVTKDQIPILLKAAELIESFEAKATQQWINGFCCCGYMYTDQNEKFLKEWSKCASNTPAVRNTGET